MRNDLSPAFKSAIESSYRAPIQLMVMHFDAGDIYLSDRDILVNGIQYQGLIEDWGNISTVSTGATDVISETLQLTVSIWNGGTNPISNKFIEQDPTDVEVDLYQTFDGLAPEDIAIIGTFTIQDPISFSEVSRLLSLDLVSINMKYDVSIGPLLTKTDWPNALDSDVNKGIDLIIGDAGTVKTLKAKTALVAKMKGSILKLPTIVNSHENLDDLGFPTENAFIVIDEEIMHYSTRDSDTFIVDIRGANSTVASEHSDGATILEYITDHTYIIGQGPLSDVYDIRAENTPVDASKYTLDLLSNPARIIFQKQPTYITYATGARNLDLDFDATAGNNTAYQPHYSYDPEKKSYGAVVSKNYRVLSVLQTDQEEDIGEVVRAFLAVEHWETAQYNNDRVDVYVEGIGIVGQLSKPNAEDITTVAGEIDIDHGHAHTAGGTHFHASADPVLITLNPSHDHSSSSNSTYTLFASGLGPTIKVYAYNGATDFFDFNDGVASNVNNFEISVTWNSPTTIGATFYYSLNGSGYSHTLYNGVNKWSVGYGRVTNTRIVFSSNSTTSGSYTTVTASASLQKIGPVIVDGRSTNVQANINVSGQVYNQGVDNTGTSIKDSDDVNDLATANRQLENISTTSSSKKLTDKFDLTKHLETISWDWFLNRQIELRYEGSTDTVKILVTYINFEVEYRPRQISVTDNITCKPIGTIENRPDAVIQYLLEKAGIQTSIMGSLNTPKDQWNDENIWDDTLIWSDGGEVGDVPIGAAFEEAAARYSFLNYKIDGILSATSSIRESINQICRQSRGRLFWGNGKVKLAVREKSDKWYPIREIGKTQTRLRSISVDKEPLSKLNNSIDLFFRKNRVSSESLETSKYDATVTKVDNRSIFKHGEKRNDSNWLFDLVRDDSMALDLADYYIWRYGEPSTNYKFTTYLQNFDIEKEDIIRFSSDFFNFDNIKLRILDSSRVIGSGKLDKINTIEVTGESIRQKFYTEVINDTVTLVESVSVGFYNTHDMEDGFSVSDEVKIVSGPLFSETINLSDSINVTFNMSSKINDTLTLSDFVAIDEIFILVSDLISIEDYQLIDTTSGFGITRYGTGLFGSPVNTTNGEIDNIIISDEIIITLS